MSHEDNKKPMNPNRELLIQMSVQAFELRQHNILNAKSINEAAFWEGCTINYMLLHYIYKTDGATEFNTFNQWKEKNATIKKGSKAFAIWGQPIKAIKRGEEPEQPQNQLPELKEQLAAKYQFWPMCYLFSNNQVLMPEERKTEAEPTETEQTEEPTEAINVDFL